MVDENDMFSSIEDKEVQEDTLLKYRVVVKGEKVLNYKENDIILIKANLVRKIKYDALKEYYYINNEDNIFCKIENE